MADSPTRRLAAILAADMVGYSRLIEQDEAGTVARLQSDREELIDPAVARHGGRLVRMAGDGALVEFPSVVEATQCAIDIQRGMSRRNAGRDAGQRLVFRIGINLGDIIVERDNLHGEGINIAARLESLAEPGGIAISEDAARHVDGKVDAELEFVGEHAVKNIERPVRVWRVASDRVAHPRRRSHATRAGARRRWLAPVLGAGLVVALAAALWRPTQPPPAEPVGSAQRAPEPRARPSLAVLPFENLSDDPEQAYFADGIADDLITDLSQVSGLLVTARHSAFAYKSRSVSVGQVAEELGVRFVLEGSVRKSGQRMRINAQLTDARSGGTVWAERYDREFADIFELQDEVARRIVAALSVQLTRTEEERLAHRYTDSAEAYDYFLQGQEQYFRLTRANNARARELYRAAIERDPAFGRAYGTLAVTHARDAWYGWSDDAAGSLDEALWLARRGVELDEGLSHTHWALGFVLVLRGEYDTARVEAERSVALDPNDADGYGLLGWVHTFAGEHERALDWLDRGLRLETHPGSLYLQVLGQAQYWAGRAEEAVATFEQMNRINPNLIDGRLHLAAAYVRLGRIEDAQWEAQEVLALNPRLDLRKWARRYPSAERLIADLLQAGLE